MISPTRVLVAGATETQTLRLRLMVEAEGAAAVSLADVASLGSAGVVLAVISPGLVERVRQDLPGVPQQIVSADEDWEAVRRQIAAKLAAPAAPEAPEVGAMTSAFAHARILLVDDSVTYREFLRLELSRHGAEVVTCGSAQVALERLEEDQWDCVLVDLVMPNMDGVDFCARAARLRREKHRRFLLGVLSSREGKTDLLRSLEAGADVFWGKSQDMEVFCARLGALLRRIFLGK